MKQLSSVAIFILTFISFLFACSENLATADNVMNFELHMSVLILINAVIYIYASDKGSYLMAKIGLFLQTSFLGFLIFTFQIYMKYSAWLVETEWIVGRNWSFVLFVSCFIVQINYISLYRNLKNN